MKKLFTIFTFVFALSFILGMNTSAQDQPTSIGPAPINNSIDRVPFIQQPVTFPDLLAGPGYGGKHIPAPINLVTIPVPAGTPFVPVGAPYTTLLQGGDFGAGGILYATRSPSTLITINTTTGVQTVLGAITGVTGGQTITAMGYHPGSNTMYLGTTNVTLSQLYTLNTTTRVATLVGTVTNCAGLIAIGVNCAGEIYGTDIVGDNGVKINPTTGAGTVLGPLGVNINYAQDADFEFGSNILYLAAYTTAGGWYTMNLTTGAATLVTSWPGTEVTALGIVGSCTTFTHDYAAGPFLSLPVQFVKNNPYSIKAKITNLGTVAETNVPIAFFVNNAQQTSVNLSLTAGQEDSVSYTWTPTAAGSYDLKWISRLTTDENKGNDTVETTVTVLNAPIVDIFCDNFSGTTSNWVITNDGGTCVWQIETPPYPNNYTLPATSSGGVLAADADDCGSGTTTLTTATTITINCSAYENINLHFDNDWNAIDAQDQAIVDYSTNGGTTWTNLITWGGTDVRNTHEVKPMPNATQMANVKVRFKSVQPGWDWWWAIDNVCLRGAPATGITQNGSNVPSEYALMQNYPNPFNPTTNIKFDIPEQGFVSLKVYDVVGKEIATLVNETKSAGSYIVDFDGSNLSSGAYFYRLEVGSFTAVKRMILLK